MTAGNDESGGLEADTDSDDVAGDRCGATCRDGSPCKKWPVAGGDRCRLHGGHSPGAPEGNQYNRRHGLHADPANVLHDLVENDPEAYEWIMAKYDSYLDVAPFEDGSALADQLKQVCVREHAIWQASGLQLDAGVVTQQTRATDDGDLYKVAESNPVNAPLDRMEKTVVRRLEKLGIMPSPDQQAVDAEQDRVEMLRDAMEGIDDE